MVAHRDPRAKGRADNARIAYESKILPGVNKIGSGKVSCISGAKVTDQYIQAGGPGNDAK
jgi:hypothetical protein